MREVKANSTDKTLVIESTAINKAAMIYRAIYHPFRLKIIEVVHKAGRINVTNLNKKLREDKSLLSQQLKILRDVHILTTEKEGKQVFYAVDYKQLNKIRRQSVRIGPMPRNKPITLSQKKLKEIKARVQKAKEPTFTTTELQIIAMICGQKTNEEMGEVLQLSKRTVEDYRQRIIKKMNVRNTVGLVLYAVKNGMVTVETLKL